MEKRKKNFEPNKRISHKKTNRSLVASVPIDKVREQVVFKSAPNLNKAKYENPRVFRKSPFDRLVSSGLRTSGLRISRKTDRLRQALLRKPAYSAVLHIRRKNVLFSKFVRRVLFIRISPNNTMASLSTLSGRISHTMSVGKLKLKSSKRTFRFVHKLVLERFFESLRKKKLLSSVIIKILAPKRMRHRITKDFLKAQLKQKDRKKYFLMGLSKLCFNGCRAPKQRRKKRKGLQIFKA